MVRCLIMHGRFDSLSWERVVYVQLFGDDDFQF